MTFLKQYGWFFIILSALIVSVILRVILPWNTIFTPSGIIFTGVDAYYYLHLADLITRNGMQIPKVDMYFDFPVGLDYSTLPSSFNAYAVFIAVLAWVVSLGNPTKEIVSIVSALHPAILGILALIPIFFIAKKLFKNNWLASGTMAIGAVLPGEYMGRAMLGACDTHCLEIFLFSYAVMFAVLALNDGKVRILWIILSGLTATAYQLIWQGAIIFPVILAVFAVLWLLWTRIKGNPDFENTAVITSILAIELVGYLVMSSSQMSNTIIMLLAPLFGLVAFLLYTIATQSLRNWVYLTPVGVLLLAGAGVVVSLQFVGFTFYPEWLTNAIRQITNLVMWHAQSTTAEELPILITLGTVTPEIPWAYFSITWYLAFIGIGILIYYWRKNDLNISFLLIWTILMLIPTLAMRRFAYYFAINVSLVTAWTLWVMYQFVWRKYE